VGVIGEDLWSPGMLWATLSVGFSEAVVYSSAPGSWPICVCQSAFIAINSIQLDVLSDKFEIIFGKKTENMAINTKIILTLNPLLSDF
jgi:hypothetical protein